jgi:hypothetical protein
MLQDIITPIVYATGSDSYRETAGSQLVYSGFSTLSYYADRYYQAAFIVHQQKDIFDIPHFLPVKISKVLSDDRRVSSIRIDRGFRVEFTLNCREYSTPVSFYIEYEINNF